MNKRSLDQAGCWLLGRRICSGAVSGSGLAGLLVAAILLAGCRETVPVAPAASPLVPKDQPASRLELSVGLVCGMDGGPLRRGKEGWLRMHYTNTSAQTVLAITWVELGKGGGDVGKPAYYADGLWFGLRVAQMRCEFIDARGHAVHVLTLDPPDPLYLLPHHATNSIRRITAPPRPGVYQMRVSLDLSPPLDLWSSLNAQAQPPEPEQSMTLFAPDVPVRID